jgi:hypothetical protein
MVAILGVNERVGQVAVGADGVLTVGELGLVSTSPLGHSFVAKHLCDVTGLDLVVCATGLNRELLRPPSGSTEAAVEGTPGSAALGAGWLAATLAGARLVARRGRLEAAPWWRAKWGLVQAAFGAPWSGQSPAAISLSQPSRQHSGRGKTGSLVPSGRTCTMLHAALGW